VESRFASPSRFQPNKGVDTMTVDKQHAHALLDRIPAGQMIAAVSFLEFLLLYEVDIAPAASPVEDEEIGEEEEQAVARSKEWFKNHDGIPFEQVVAELGFTMDEIRNANKDPEV
jgi:hypothetical protein